MFEKRSRFALLVLGLALVASACGGSDSTDTSAAPEASDTSAMDIEENDEFSFGEPADASSADKTVDIEASDSLSFDPAEVEVTAGETITFRVANPGALPHEFVIGDQATQDEHEAEMMAMMEDGGEMTMEDEANAINLDPGETKEVTWRFTESGTVLFGCHQPGHYAGGMKGTITIDS